LKIDGNVIRVRGTAVLVCVLSISPAVAQGPPTVGSKLTHMGQLVNDHVLLNWDSNDSGCSTGSSCVPLFTRTLLDGSIVENFAIPSGKALVVTDVDWLKNVGTVDPNEVTSLILRYGGLFALWGNVIRDSSAFPTDAKNEHLVSGLVLTDMSKLTVQTSSPPTRIIITMRGYLVSR